MALAYIEFGAALLAACYFGWHSVRALSTGRVRLPLADKKNYYSRRSRATEFFVILSWYLALGIAAIVVMVRIAL